MSTQTCSRCDEELVRPYRETANYVRSMDFAEEEPTEVYYAMIQTEETEELLDEIFSKVDKHRQTLAAEAAHPEAPETIEITGERVTKEENGGSVETVEIEEIPFSIPTEKFEHKVVESPNVVQDDDSVAFTYTNVEMKEIPKTGVICSDCLHEDDEIIWGIDK